MANLPIILLLLTISVSAYSKNVELKISTKWVRGNDVKVINTTVLAKLGQEWEIPFEGSKTLKLKMTVTDDFEAPVIMNDDNEMILIGGNIIQVENGMEKVMASPKVITHIGREVILTKDNDEGEFLEFKIQPNWEKDSI